MDTLAKSSRRPARLASVVLEELAHQIIGGTLPEGERAADRAGAL